MNLFIYNTENFIDIYIFYFIEIIERNYPYKVYQKNAMKY